MSVIIKQLIFNESVRKKILKGVTITAQAVGTTLGSRGRNVAMEQSWGDPIIVHDGVTVARNIILKDPYENMAAKLVISAAQRTNDEAGDGTTTATILAHAIVKEGLKNVSAGLNPMVLRKGIERAVAEIIKDLQDQAMPIKSFEEMKQIASISAADPEMGELIATAIQKVGENGVVTVQESSKNSIDVEYKDGMEFDRGLLSPYLITNQDRLEAVLEGSKKNESVFIVILNEDMKNTKLIKIFEKILNYDQNAQVLVIADDYDNDSIASIVMTRVKGGKLIAAVKSPEFGDHRTHLLNDIAAVTGGKVIGGSTGIPVDSVTLDDIGRAEKVISTRNQTIIIGGKGKKEEIEERIKGIRKYIADAKTEFEKDKYEARLAKIVGGVAVINVGASSEAEMREKKERVYDAVNATQAAIAEGVVPGGGVALIRAAGVAEGFIDTSKMAIGIQIVCDAVKYPFRRLVENAGVDDSGFILGKVLENDDVHIGYNVDTERMENMLESGIIDPVKVTRSALQNAASTAIMLLTTEVMIAVDREPYKSKGKSNDDNLGIGQFPD